MWPTQLRLDALLLVLLPAALAAAAAPLMDAAAARARWRKANEPPPGLVDEVVDYILRAVAALEGEALREPCMDVLVSRGPAWHWTYKDVVQARLETEGYRVQSWFGVGAGETAVTICWDEKKEEKEKSRMWFDQWRDNGPVVAVPV